MSPMGNDLLQRIAAEKLAIKRRDEKMYAMYQSGVGFSLIAREFEMSRQNAINRIRRWQLSLAKVNCTNPFELISDRTAKLLRDNGMTTLEAVKNANPQELLQIKNFGRKSLNEVQRYFFS